MYEKLTFWKISIYQLLPQRASNALFSFNLRFYTNRLNSKALFVILQVLILCSLFSYFAIFFVQFLALSDNTNIMTVTKIYKH